jgi:hypothetical protein
LWKKIGGTYMEFSSASSMADELPGSGVESREWEIRRVKRDEVVKFTFVAFVVLSWCGGARCWMQFLSLVDSLMDFAFKGLRI